MSFRLIPSAFDTKLGNASAKSLLCHLAEASDNDGFSYASVETLSAESDISPRMILRLIQIFEAIGLVERLKNVPVKDRILKYAFQINRDILGEDLRGKFEAEYSRTRGPNVSQGQTAKSVPGTENTVLGTEKGVPGTVPPHPLIGGTSNEPVIDPEKPPSPAPQSKNAKKVPDPRHTLCKDLLAGYWKNKNPTIEMPWGKPEAGALGMVLSASPDLTVEQFRHLLGNRWKSEVNHSDRPSRWLHGIHSYAGGRVDRFGNSVVNGGKSNGNIARHSTKESRNLEALAAVIAKYEDCGSAHGDGDGAERRVGPDEPEPVRGKVIDAANR